MISIRMPYGSRDLFARGNSDWLIVGFFFVFFFWGGGGQMGLSLNIKL